MGEYSMEIFDSKHLLLDIEVGNQREAFVAIASLAHKLNITNNVEGLVKDLIKREEVSTTGMADEVAIPHAMSADFNRPAIIVARFKKGVEWQAVGGKPVKVAFALLIPEKSRGTLHMRYLQNIATALLDEKFNRVILESTDQDLIINTITSAIEKPADNSVTEAEKVTVTSPETKVNQSENKLIVGVSSCATGVAHTYMAREALEKHGKDVGYDV
jgi:PTS system fructose-specific IIC component